MSVFTSHRIISAVAAVFLAAATAVGLAVSPASATSTIPSGTTATPKHIWIDSSQPLSGGGYGFSVVFTFPQFTENAVSHGTAPRITDGSTHCVAGRPVSPSTFSCTATGNAVPGEYSFDVSMRTLRTAMYSWSIPVTVCAAACSDGFSLVQQPTLRYLVNTDLGKQAQGKLAFNVDWNADPDSFAISRPSNSHGIVGGTWQAIAEEPKNGSAFGYQGKFTTTGTYSVTIAVHDEFGVEHDVTQVIQVCTPEQCPDLAAALANTGNDGVSTMAWFAGAVLSLLAGAGLLILRRRA